MLIGVFSERPVSQVTICLQYTLLFLLCWINPTHRQTKRLNNVRDT